MKDAWDRFLLIGAAVVVTALALFFVFKSVTFAGQFPDDSEPAGWKPGTKLPEVEGRERCQGAAELVKKPRTWDLPKRGNPEKNVPLFTSIPVIELNGRAGDPGDPTFVQMRKPVPNIWLIENKLDYTKRGVLSFDPDGDGFTNLEEWRSNTNPQDPKSHPELIKKVKFVERVGEPYSITFQGEPGTGEFQFRREKTDELPKKTFFVKKGKVSADRKFRVDSYTKAEERSSGDIINRIDRSILTITYLPTGEKFNLTRRVRQDIFTYYAKFDFSLSSSANFLVKNGATFKLPDNKDNTVFKLIGLTEDVATVEYESSVGTIQREQITKEVSE